MYSAEIATPGCHNFSSPVWALYPSRSFLPKLPYPFPRRKSFRSLSGFQVPAAEHAARIDGINEVLVGWAFSIGTNFCVHSKWLSDQGSRRKEAGHIEW